MHKVTQATNHTNTFKPFLTQRQMHNPELQAVTVLQGALLLTAAR